MSTTINWHQLAAFAAKAPHLHGHAIPHRSPRTCWSSQQHCCSSTHRSEGSDTAQQEPLLSRRSAAQLSALLALIGAVPAPASALGFKKELKKKKAREEDYTVVESGLKVYDLAKGSGAEVKEGSKIKVHFDCMFKGLNVESTRSARLLGGNRSIAEPFEFIAGGDVRAAMARDTGDSAGGLFIGGSGPTPPKALAGAVIGMHQGGKRSVLVPPELGFGSKGNKEIPPNTPFELIVEILTVV